MAGEKGPTPRSDIYLCDCHELPIDYSHTYIFKSKEEQKAYFRGRVRFTFTNYTYLRKDASITIDKHVDEFQNCNYLFYQNGVGKLYYCFITGREYVNENASRIYITTDLIQTNWFELRIEPSYIERMHVPRWTADGLPTDEFEPEGLEFGEYVEDVQSPRDIATLKNNYIAVCSNPLGKVVGRKQWGGLNNPSGQGGNDTDCGDWENGIISVDGFRFIKGQEGWSPSKHSVFGQYVIAYGITPDGEKDIFNMLDAKSPLQEDYGAQVNYDTINKVYGNGRNFGKNTVEYFKTEFHVDNQHKFDALIDLFYNTGQGSLIRGDLHDVLKAHPNDESKVRPIWENHWTSGSSHIRARRKAECDIYFGKGYKQDPISVYNANGVIVGTLKDNNGDGWLPKCGSDPGGDTFEAERYKWQYPVRGKKCSVSSLYGKRTDPITGIQGKMHYGIDIAPFDRQPGLPIYATRDGVVEIARDWGGAGLMVRILHDDINMKTLYMHNSKLLVKEGERVKAGDIIAQMGTTGNSTGVHCHYQLELPPFGNANAVNPIPSAKEGDVM